MVTTIRDKKPDPKNAVDRELPTDVETQENIQAVANAQIRLLRLWAQKAVESLRQQEQCE